LAALIWEFNENLSPEKVREIVVNSGDILTNLEDKTISGKRINAYSALQSTDIVPPTAQLELSNNNKDLKEGDELLISANFSEAIDSSSTVEVILTGSNEATSTMQRASSTTYTYTHTVGSGNGTSTITLSGALDLFGNELEEQPTENNEFLVDNIAPEKPVIEIIPEKINYISSSSVDISGSAATGTSLYIELEKDSNLATSSLELGVSSSTFAFNFDLSSSSASYLEDGEIVVTLSSTDEAGNTSYATSTSIFKDTLVPEIISLKTQDVNSNGKIDLLKLTFNKAILDSTASSSDFTFTNYVIPKISTTSLDILDDNILYLDLTEKETYDTSATSTLTYTKDTLSDDFDNYLENTEIVSVDKALPIVEKLGDNTTDFEIIATSSSDLIFSEELASSSKTLVEEQILKGSSSSTISFIWDSNSLNIYTEEGVFFDNDIILDIEDTNSNINKEVILIDSSLEEYQASIDSQNQITLNASTTEAVINYQFRDIEIIIEENVSSTINLSSLIYNQAGLLPGINIISNNILNIETKISSSTTITSSSTSWNEKISPASSTDFTLPSKDGYNRSFDLAVKMGSSDEDLFFDKAVRILFPGKANKKVAFSNIENNFTEITNTCSSDNIEDVATPCKINVDSDLVIWTSHFSTFVLYTESVIEEDPPSSSSSSGGGYYIPPTIDEEEEEIPTVPTSTEEVIEEEVLEELIEEDIIEEIIEEAVIKIDLFKKFVDSEKQLLKNINLNLSKRLSGRILLQVEENGEAWYINPLNNRKYYLGRPLDAYNIMRALGLGISNNDFESFSGYAPKRLSGRILLKVQDYGKAYYVDPLTLKMHYLGRPDDAFSLMREMGLGITNENVRKIDIDTIDLK
nr:hypothetical protein [Patescibacteria group bacterium]